MAKSVKARKSRTSSPPRDDGSSVSEQATIATSHRALSGWPVIIAWAAMIIFALQACTHMVAAGDTWVAMACGRHFVNHGVDTVEPFSANSHKPGPTPEEVKTWPHWAQWITEKVGLKTVKAVHPTGWIDQNWLTHVIFYLLVPKSSYADGVSFTSDALVYWKFAIYIVTVICVYYTGRLLGVNPVLSAVFASFALFAGRSYLDIRPAGFSNLLVAVFLLVLVLATYRNILYLWLIVPLTVFWGNVHGGYIYVFIMLVPFFVLHLLTVLPRKWTISVGSILLWFSLYTFIYKYRVGLHGMLVDFSSLSSRPPFAGTLLYLIIVLIIVSLILTAQKKIKDSTSYGFHIVSTALIILVLLILMSIAFENMEIPSGLNVLQQEEVDKYIYHNLLEFLMAIIVLTTLIVVTTLFKDKLVSVGRKGIYHIIASGFVTFIAVGVFNPFHLTNFTHTFVISVSKHAERWRDIHEWKSAFDWTNRVGTGFPFLVLFILCIGLFVLWLLSRFMVPKLMKASKSGLEAQKKSFTAQWKTFGVILGILACWVAFISFGFLGLDIGSFFFCTLFAIILLLSVYRNVYFIFLMVPLTLLAVWTGHSLAGYGGRNIYPYIILPAYVILYIVASLLSKPIKDKYDPLHIAFVASSAIVSLVLMAVIFNPFGSETLIRRFFPLERAWRPIYVRNVSLSFTSFFHILYMVNIVAVFVWLAMPQLGKFLREAARETNEPASDETYQLSRIDLAIMTIAAMTVYMAVRSRRFIPIAAEAACPIVAMFIEQIVHAVSASRNFHKRKHLVIPSMSQSLQLFFTVVGAVVVLFLGIGWGLKFKRVYLNPWPPDPKFSSVFMRMTASDAKPFYAMKFIRDNHLKGKMFNYWTEGGFIAWGEQPDPKTGRTPLQLFMDGRAQAAYNRKAFDLWSHIMAGGQITTQILEISRARNQPVTADDYVKIGQWMDKQLRDYGVWVVLMPSAVFDDPDRQLKYYAIRGLEYNPYWRIVFHNRRQRLYVDIRTPQGKELYDGIFNGSTIYPDDYHANLMRARNCLIYLPGKEDKKRGLDFAMKAFELNPTSTPMMEILAFGENFPELSAKVGTFCQEFFDKFIENQDQWARQDGFRLRVDAARLASSYLRKLAREQNNKELENFYANKEREFINEMIEMAQTKRW